MNLKVTRDHEQKSIPIAPLKKSRKKRNQWKTKSDACPDTRTLFFNDALFQAAAAGLLTENSARKFGSLLSSSLTCSRINWLAFHEKRENRIHEKHVQYPNHRPALPSPTIAGKLASLRIPSNPVSHPHRPRC